MLAVGRLEDGQTDIQVSVKTVRLSDLLYSFIVVLTNITLDLYLTYSPILVPECGNLVF